MLLTCALLQNCEMTFLSTVHAQYTANSGRNHIVDFRYTDCDLFARIWRPESFSWTLV